MIITDNKTIAEKAKHLTTTAKQAHQWEYRHDSVAYNYRLPNINAALGCAQMENLNHFLNVKKELADSYRQFFNTRDIHFISEPADTRANFWLNAIILSNKAERDLFLKKTNDMGVMTRPIWQLMNHSPMYRNAQAGDLENALWLEQRVVNIPSSVRI